MRATCRLRMPGSSTKKSAARPAPKRSAQRAARRRNDGSCPSPTAARRIPARIASPSKTTAQIGSGDRLTNFQALNPDGRIKRRSAPLAHDQRHVERVMLVVEAERVHAEVDAQAKRELTLRLSTRRNFKFVVPGLIAVPGAGEVVLRVDHGRTPTQLSSLELRFVQQPSGRRVQHKE